jgi:hypothetical protein
MPKKTAKKSRARKGTAVKDLKPSRGGTTKGGFNPKELGVDKSVPWQRQGG